MNLHEVTNPIKDFSDCSEQCSPRSFPIEGSPAWFFERSQSTEIRDRVARIEILRGPFLEQYSAEALSKKSDNELLHDVFCSDSGMLNLLTMNEGYSQFGAGSKYPYLWPLRFNPNNGNCHIHEKCKGIPVSLSDAPSIAGEITKQLLSCVYAIDSLAPLDSISKYIALSKYLDSVPFGKFPWALKYYQMLYPQFFPGMYADHTLSRAIGILGLKKHGNKRVLNLGEISLFINECGIGNIMFNCVYADQWDWEGDPGICEYAQKRFSQY